MQENQNIALSIFLTAGSAVLVLYATLWHKGIFSNMWQKRFQGRANRIGAWISSALIATGSVIATAGVMIGDEQSSKVLLPFAVFLVSAIGWPVTCLRAESEHPKGEPIAVMITALSSVWLCIAATNYGTSKYLAPLTVSVMFHHLVVDAMWWVSL